MLRRIFTMFILATAAIYSQVVITNTNVYHTAEQMLLANEINESGEPFAEALGYNLDDLDPMVPYLPDSISYNLGINNYEYSRYQLGTIVSRSGMGLHIIWGPIVGANAAMETDPNFDGSFTGGANGFKEDDEFMKTVMHFAMLANHTPPSNPFPQFAEFYEGDPHYAQPVDAQNFTHDFSTLRWDRNKMDKTLNPASMGQALMKQYLWAQDMLSAFHDADDNGIDPDGTITPDSTGNPHFDPDNNVFYGGDGLDGFIGMVLTAEALNKVKFILTNLAYDGSSLGMVDPMSYDPANGIKYFPHKVAVTEEIVDATMPPKPSSFTVSDSKSDLFDQTSLLWGTISFKNMMDPDNSEDAAHLAYHTVFDGDPFPQAMAQSGNPGPFDLMKGASMVIAQNLLAMHFNSTEGTFVDEANYDGSSVTQGNVITTFDAGYIIAIFKHVADEFAGMPLAQMASDAAKAQADFLISKLKNSDGSFANSYEIGKGKEQSFSTLESQSAAIRGLYAAYELTNDQLYLNEANAAYTILINNFYVYNQHAFRTTLNSNEATYTPLNVAVVSGALRSASLIGSQTDAPKIYTEFFLNVGNSMQLAEGANTGEVGNDSDHDGIPFIPEQQDNLPPVFATEATLSIVTDVKSEDILVDKFELLQNYPNPFNPSTNIKFNLPSHALVSLKVFNLLGQEVAELVNERLERGVHTVNFNADKLASGIYLYKLSVNGIEGSFVQTRKMMLMK